MYKTTEFKISGRMKLTAKGFREDRKDWRKKWKCYI